LDEDRSDMTASSSELGAGVRCLVVGTGEMGREHLRALAGLGVGELAGFAPSEATADKVRALGVRFFSGALAAAVGEFAPTHAIVASPVDKLASTAGALVELGVSNLLVEKPGALDEEEGTRLSDLAVGRGARIDVAYNRRFYGSVRTALRAVTASGESVTSVAIEVTEWSNTVAALSGIAPTVKARWFAANSLHVIDAALFPFGVASLECGIVTGGLPWHPRGSAFAGCGRCANGALFSYHANWDAPGRWGFEWLTSSQRYVFRPLEALQVIERDTVRLEPVPLDDDLDERYKPGVFLQDEAFLTGRGAERLCTYPEALARLELASKMAGYEG